MCQKSNLFQTKSLLVISLNDGRSGGGGGVVGGGDAGGDGGVFGSDLILHTVIIEQFFLVAS